jgi:HSP20 family molecular chaperone IbpA
MSQCLDLKNTFWPNSFLAKPFDLMTFVEPATRILTLSHLIFINILSRLTIFLDLRGLEKDKVNMRIQDSPLIVSEEHASSDERDEGTTHISERSFGSFKRLVRFP